MTSRERILAGLHGKAVDYTPFSPFMAYVWETFSEEVRRGGVMAFLKSIGSDPMWAERYVR